MDEQSLDNQWHTIDVQKVLKRLQVSEDGLSGDQAGQRLEETGPNSMEVEEGVSPFRMLARQVHNPPDLPPGGGGGIVFAGGA